MRGGKPVGLKYCSSGFFTTYDDVTLSCTPVDFSTQHAPNVFHCPEHNMEYTGRKRISHLEDVRDGYDENVLETFRKIRRTHQTASSNDIDISTRVERNETTSACRTPHPTPPRAPNSVCNRNNKNNTKSTYHYVTTKKTR